MKLKLIQGKICNNYGEPIWETLLFEYLVPQPDGTYSVRCDLDDRWTPGTLMSKDGKVVFVSVDQNTYWSDVPWIE